MAEAPSQNGAVPPHLKPALKAFKKRLKLARLDDESRLGGRYTSKGGNSGIIGILPPDRYPQAIWDELEKLGKIRRSGQGLYELVVEE